MFTYQTLEVPHRQCGQVEDGVDVHLRGAMRATGQAREMCAGI